MLTTLQIVHGYSDFTHLNGFVAQSIFANMSKLAWRYESLEWGQKFKIRDHVLSCVTRPLRDQIRNALWGAF